MLRAQSQIETAMFQGALLSASSLATAPEKLLGIVKHHSLRRQGQLEELNPAFVLSGTSGQLMP
jgi:hypothetical protein